MIYKFKSKVAADVIMMGPGGDQVLGLIGKSPSSQGIIEVAAMPAAIRAIEQAVAADEASRKQAEEDEGGHAAVGDGVSLRQRAWPLLDMLKRAQGANEDIVWGV